MEVKAFFSIFPSHTCDCAFDLFYRYKFGSLDGVALIGASFDSNSGYSNGESLPKIWELSLLYTKKVKALMLDTKLGGLIFHPKNT